MRSDKTPSTLFFSVITPSYNQGPFIDRTIQSVLDQKYSQFEHIVCDGGSKDNTVEVLKRYPHLQWSSEKDGGQSAALNKGLKVASGDIVAWINSDDWYEPETFATVARFFSENPDKHVVMGNCRCLGVDGRLFEVTINRERGFEEMRKYWISRSIPSQPAIFFRRELLDECGMLDESLHYAMDYDLWLRFSQKHRFFHIDQVFANYLFHPAAKGGDGDFRKFIPECRKVYARYSNTFCPRYLFARLLQKA